MNAPVSWTSRVETYLAYRRRHGFKLSVDATQLGSFARFADQIGTEDHLTVALRYGEAELFPARTKSGRYFEGTRFETRAAGTGCVFKR